MSRKRTFFLLTALGLVLYLQAQDTNQKNDLNRKYNEALVSFGQNKPDEAIAAYKRIIAEDPTFWRAYDKLVKAYNQLKQIDQAQSYLEGLLGTSPDNLYAHYGVGLAYHEKRDYSQAIAQYKLSIELKAEFVGVYERLVQAYRELKKLEEAIAYLEGRIKLNSEDGYAHYGLGYVYFVQKSWPKVLHHLDKVVELKPDLIKAYFTRAKTYFNMRRYEEAVKDNEKTVELAERQSDLEMKLDGLNNTGVTYIVGGNYTQALQYYERTLEISRQLGNRLVEEITLTNMGNAYRQQGNYDRALEYYQKALMINRQLGNLSGEAVNLNTMGLAYQGQGNYGQALEYLQKGLAIRQQLGDRAGEIQTFIELGDTYQKQGRYAQALEYSRKVLILIQQLGSRHGEAGILNYMGDIYLRQDHYTQALEHFQKSLTMSRQVGDRWAEASALGQLGTVYLRQGNYGQALEYFQKSLTMSQQLGDKLGEIASLKDIGSAYTRTGNHARAIELLRSALKIAKEINDPQSIWGLHAGLARALEDQHPSNTEEAFAHYKSAVETIKSLRSQLRQPGIKMGFLEDKIWIYERLCNLLARQHAQAVGAGKGYDREAFWYAEESKARVFVELLEESRASLRITEGVDTGLSEKERALQAGLSDVQVRLEKEEQSFQIKELEKRRDALYNEYETLIGELRRRNPAYAQLKYPEVITVEQCQRLLDEETVLLEYLLGEKSSLLFAVSKDHYQLISLSGRKKIEERVRKLLKAFTLDGTVDPSLQLIYVGNASALYDMLIKPAASMLKGKKRVMLAPDGVLYHLPFSALLTKEAFIAGKVDFKSLPYLVKQHAVSYIQSASVLKSLAERKKEKPDGQKKFLAFADPDYEKKKNVAKNPVASRTGAEDSLSTADAERGESWKRLPYSGEEVRQIAGLYPRDQVRLFLRGEATEENVKKSNLWEYERIHFAAHSIANEAKPQFSGIILSTKDGSGEDGHLQMYEIFNLRLNARLVVLSGCETGLGKQTNGEGMVGLMRAFLYAGAENIVASLWKIEDRSTSEFMRKFYMGLEKSSTAHALRAAQLDSISQSHYSHPYYWGAFVLYGGRDETRD